MRSKSYNSIDHLRCVLIILVILIHIVNFGDRYPYVKDTINFFFMPAFFMITGYLVNIDKTAKEFGVYMGRIVLPYTIMVLGYACLSLYLPVRDGLTEFSLPAMARVLFVTSIGPYWFLHTMIICGVLYYLSFRLFRSFGTAVCFIMFGLFLLLTVQYTELLTMRNAAFYFAGVAIRLFHGNFSGLFRPTLWAALPFIAVVADRGHREYGDLAVAILVVSFVTFVPKLFQYMHGKPLEISGFIGRNTFPIYIFHPIFTMAAKYMLPWFGFDKTGLVHTATTILLGLAGSLALAFILDKTHLSRCFGRERLIR